MPLERRRLTKQWTIELDSEFASRVEEGNLVLFAPGRTIWMVSWGPQPGLTPEGRLQMIRETAAPDPVKKLEPAHPTLKRFAYLLKESDPERGTRWGLYAFTIAPEEHLQMAYYFDVEKDLEWAIQAWDSLVYGEGVSGSPA